MFQLKNINYTIRLFHIFLPNPFNFTYKFHVRRFLCETFNPYISHNSVQFNILSGRKFIKEAKKKKKANKQIKREWKRKKKIALFISRDTIVQGKLHRLIVIVLYASILTVCLEDFLLHRWKEERRRRKKERWKQWWRSQRRLKLLYLEACERNDESIDCRLCSARI